jgi:hypothetical protein
MDHKEIKENLQGIDKCIQNMSDILKNMERKDKLYQLEYEEKIENIEKKR